MLKANFSSATCQRDVSYTIHKMDDNETPKVFINDINLNDLSNNSDLNLSKANMNDNNLITSESDDVQIIDSFLNNDSELLKSSSSSYLNPHMDVEEVQAQKNEQSINNKANDFNSNLNEEIIVESPTATPIINENFTFRCVYCDRLLAVTDNPKLLECLHNACTNCINSKLFENNESSSLNGNQIINCPVCNVKCDSSKLIDNQFLIDLSINEENNLQSKITDLKCSSCSDEAIASSYCADCSEFICDNCVEAHRRLKITKDHTIKPKEDGLNELNVLNNGSSNNPSLFCSMHPQEKLSLFCETCDRLTCRDCQLIEHREHKYKFTNEIASEAKKYIADMLKDVGYKRALLTSALKVIDDRQNLITEKKKALVTEITQLVVKLTQTISTRGKQLVAKLTEVCDSKQKTLQEKKSALEQLSKMTDHCIEFTQYALDNGTDMALLYSKKQVTEHLKRIKCKRADIPNPEIPVRIHLALDKVPELIKVMSTIGQIVVDGRVYLPTPPNLPNLTYSPNQSPSPVQQIRPTQQHSPSVSPLLQQSSSNNSFATNQQAPTTLNIRLTNPPPSYSQYQSNQQQSGSPYMMQSQQFNGPINSINTNITHRIPSSLTAGQISSGPHLTFNPFDTPNIQRPSMMSRNSMGPNQQQQQVSSSTHPYGMMHDRSNLRHLLQTNNNGNVYVQTGPSQYQALPQRYRMQQQSPRFTISAPPYRMPQLQQQKRPITMLSNLPPNFEIQQQQRRQQQIAAFEQSRTFNNNNNNNNNNTNNNLIGGVARWHTPQQQINEILCNNAQNRNNLSNPTINDNFRITLKQQQQQPPPPPPPTTTTATTTTVELNKNHTVTSSTIPKTPSPNSTMLQQGQETTERSLDKFCEESVKDLMATIAKLDSNGVQVLAEGRQKGGSPHVDSSTGDTAPLPKIKAELMETCKDDPNEDWCAVCMDGGELVCCDKCPKVFHQYCHIPNLSVEESDTWQCLLCMDFTAMSDDSINEKLDGELSVKEKKIAERLVLELYCQYEISLPFREIIGPDNVEYHEIIKKPIALDMIRQKLNWSSDTHYSIIEELVKDVRLMFRNAYTFNSGDSQVYSDAKNLEKFFDEQLEKFLPDYAYRDFDDDETVQPPSKKYRRIIND